MASPFLPAGATTGDSGGELSSGDDSGDVESLQSPETETSGSLAELFEKAAAHLQGLVQVASREQLLYLYARYKQTTIAIFNVFVKEIVDICNPCSIHTMFSKRFLKKSPDGLSGWSLDRQLLFGQRMFRKGELVSAKSLSSCQNDVSDLMGRPSQSHPNRMDYGDAKFPSGVRGRYEKICRGRLPHQAKQVFSLDENSNLVIDIPKRCFPTVNALVFHLANTEKE
ncbi:hypothetical protein PANDA_007788 [Ailuropoda melanoleuca]|uniref:Uncharacterized protein n=1 Tax=Ailuropoda melanoleuca TaxID=9646 RepID=D2HBA3_AILME|nr:hypothetical protein PANDA_007788 [Ailuropoda melanoleuca]